MRNTIGTYRALRKANVRGAWRVSGIGVVAAAAVRWLAYLIVAAGVVYLLSERANAVDRAADNRAAATITKQAGYIKELESILARCLSRGDQPIWIGDELHFCSTSATGIRRK